MNWYKISQYVENDDDDDFIYDEGINNDYYDEDDKEEIPYIAEETKKWLSNSKIQYPVYHGTNQSFNEFKLLDTKRYVLFSEFNVKAQGIFFTEDKETAAEYGNTILTCYVNLTNPMLDPRRTPRMGINQLPYEQEARIAYVLRNAIKDKTIEVNYGIGEKYVNKVKQDIDRRSRSGDKANRMLHNDYSWIYHVVGPCGLDWNLLDNPNVVSAMKRMGYDGTYACENNDPTGRSIFVLSPHQVKIINQERIN